MQLPPKYRKIRRINKQGQNNNHKTAGNEAKNCRSSQLTFALICVIISTATVRAP